MAGVGDWLGIASGLLAVGATGLWFQRANAIRLPMDRKRFLLAFAASGLLGLAAFAAGTGLAGGIGAGLGLANAALMLGLRAVSAQDAKIPAVRVGGPMLDFQAPDDSGALFDSVALRDRPYLLKFFRGHW
jgi:hypothetical protein